jgi:hypothetical protein
MFDVLASNDQYDEPEEEEVEEVEEPYVDR